MANITDSASPQARNGRPKIRRRGDRVIFQRGDERRTYINHRNGLGRLVEVRRPGAHYVVTYSPCGKFALAKGERDGKPLQVAQDAATSELIAIKASLDGWLIADHEDPEAFFISIDDVPIGNQALIAGISKHQLDADLAKFLGINPLLCSNKDITAILDDPRYALVRDFRFSVTPLQCDLGAGRHAESKIRHEHTNYDAMLQRAGGLLHPEVYEHVRRGVDRIVNAVRTEVA
jgi:hypothetical protein